MSVKQRVLMCPPTYFEVSYVINPWMETGLGHADRHHAAEQWQHLHDVIARLAKVELQEPQPGLPDIVFTANAGLVVGNTVLVSRFRNPERQGEEVHDLAWFREHGFKIADWPQDVTMEGAGDALLDRGTRIIWMGYGFRSDTRAAGLVAKTFGREVVSLHLTDPRFYHLDTCLCPLEHGYLMYYPGAFDAESQAKIALHVPESKRIIVEEADALAFACNAVDLKGHVITNMAGPNLQARLKQAGFTPVMTPLDEFLKAGGGAKCLTLKLVEE